MGIWRIPVDEIDRPGSFASHMSRSIVLLLNVLSQLKDSSTLLKISSMLQRTPDQGKKYLRDADRQVLAQRAFILTVKVLEDTLSELTGASDEQATRLTAAKGMTTDVSNKAKSEDSKEVLPKKAALTDRVLQGAENGVRDAAPSGAMDTEELWVKSSTDISRPVSTEPMDLEGHCNEYEKTDTSLKRNEANRTKSHRASKEKSPEIRAPELSLEDLSISSKQQQLQVAKASAEEPVQRLSRKRKLLEDTESSKTLLLDAYRVWQQGQKVMAYDLSNIEKIMSETYMLIKQVDGEAALEQAIKFCQVQMGSSMQRQSTGDTPTTPKHTKDSKELFFPLTPVSVQLTPLQLDAVTSEPLLRLSDLHFKPKLVSSCSSTAAASLPPAPQVQGACGMAYLAHEEEELERPQETRGFQQQESQLCQQMKMAAVASSSEAVQWQAETVTSTSSGHCGSQDSSKPESESSVQCTDSTRIKTRIPPNMPKLLIPSTITKFPPAITVTPPTPTLLSPKGSISEETKQKLKSVILSSQSAANVKKEKLSQPALEILETSSQESSQESDTDDDDYMDI